MEVEVDFTLFIIQISKRRKQNVTLLLSLCPVYKVETLRGFSLAPALVKGATNLKV
jgi:hypothetical protein